MNIRPWHDRVVVKREPQEQRSSAHGGFDRGGARKESRNAAVPPGDYDL